MVLLRLEVVHTFPAWSKAMPWDSTGRGIDAAAALSSTVAPACRSKKSAGSLNAFDFSASRDQCPIHASAPSPPANDPRKPPALSIFTVLIAPSAVPAASALGRSTIESIQVSETTRRPLPRYAMPPAWLLQFASGRSNWPTVLPLAGSTRKTRQGPLFALRSGVGL